jgi:hypothetical protein
MNKLPVGFVLAVLSACSAGDSKRTELPRVATSQEMEVIRALVARYRAGEEASGRYFKQKARVMPVWSRMLPLRVLRTDGLEQKHPSFDGFAVPLKVLVSYAENGHQAFSLQDSTQLLRQVRQTDILLDSLAFKPNNLLTPHLYKQPQVRQKVHGYWFYRFSQPLFSPDGNAAYIQADIAGSRESYRLSRKHGQWTVTHDALLWVE